jgi:hypothetical protein
MSGSRLRAIALIGLAVVVALGAGFLLLGRGGSASSAAPKVIKPLHPVKKHAAATARRAAAVKRTKPGAVVDGMPRPLAQALATHPVVVVALFQPGSSVDDMARAEARVGATSAGAGFVAINVLNNGHMRALTNLLGSDSQAVDRLLDDPAVLVFQRPKKLFVRFNGYVDQQTIQQAAVNAAPAGALHTVDNGDAWITQANGTCTRMRDQMQLFAASLLTSPSTDATTVVNRILGIVQSTVNDLARLKAPPAIRAKARAMVAAYNATLADLRAAFEAEKAGNRSKAQALVTHADALATKGDDLAAQLGASSCSS